MAVPEFGKNGLLPAGMFAGPIQVSDGTEMRVIEVHSGWPTDEAEIAERFVAYFSESLTRHLFENELRQLMIAARRSLDCALFFVSGGFVSDTTDPDDLHVSLIATAASLDGLSPGDRWQIDRTFNDAGWALSESADLQVTTQLAPVYPVDHARYDHTLVDLADARYLCSHPAKDDRIGGYLQLLDCEGGGSDDEILGLLAHTAASS